MKKNKKGFASRSLVAFVSLVVLSVLCIQVYAYTVDKQVDNAGTQIRLLDSSGNLTIAGALTAGTGQTITSGGLTVTAGGLTVTAGTVNLGTYTATLTNNQSIAATARLAVLTGTSGGTTNTLANPSAAGDELILLNGSTFPIVLLESASNLDSAGNITLGPDDTLYLVAKTATNWVQVSTSNN